MKGKKLLIVAIVAAFLIIAWGVALRKPETIDYAARQASLIEQADRYAERKLSLRAIPLYEEAAQINDNPEIINRIEEKLLSIYLNDGYPERYVLLTKDRALRGMGTEEEFIIAANSFTAEGNTESALQVLETARNLIVSEQIEEMYMSMRYKYSVRPTLCTEILPSVHNSIMPAFNGTNWGYINSVGAEVLPFEFTYASSFTEDGYSVVKKNGRFCCINTEGRDYGIDDNKSFSRVDSVKYLSDDGVVGLRDGAYYVMDSDFIPVNSYMFDDLTLSSCGIRGEKYDGVWRLITNAYTYASDELFEDVAVNSVGCVFEADRGMLKVDGKWYLYNIDKEGKLARQNVAFYDAKAPESDEYIAVANEQGKWGFINGNGELVVDYQYSDAKSFSDGVAAVYNGFDWFFINVENKKVFNGSAFDEAEPFHSGITQVKKDGFAAILSMINH